MKYLKDFIIGSSIPVVALFYYYVYNHPQKTYNYYPYTFIAPLSFGIWNVVSAIMGKHFNLTNRSRFFIISIISVTCTIFTVTYKKSYNFTTQEEWNKYYLEAFIGYMFAWNIVIYTLDKYI